MILDLTEVELLADAVCRAATSQVWAIAAEDAMAGRSITSRRYTVVVESLPLDESIPDDAPTMPDGAA